MGRAVVANNLGHIIYQNGLIVLIFLTLLKVICCSWNFSCPGLTDFRFEEFSRPQRVKQDKIIQAEWP